MAPHGFAKPVFKNLKFGGNWQLNGVEAHVNLDISDKDHPGNKREGMKVGAKYGFLTRIAERRIQDSV